MMNQSQFPEVSIVVIGLNESKNLDSTFQAIKKLDYPVEKLEVIYCDSSSTDNSVDIAEKYTNKVFIEKSDWPTAARGRNRGLIEAKYDIVHFVDGDIQIEKDYLKKAVETIKENNIHAVYGYLEEKSSRGINKILLSHSHRENKKSGFSDATGAGGTFRKDSLLKINGYDERIVRGEETELGIRFREAGYKIWFLDELMGIHDYGVRNIVDYFRIRFRNGMVMYYIMFLDGKSKFFKDNKKQGWRNICFNIVAFFVLTVTVLIKNFIAFGIIFLLYLIYLYIKYKFIRKKTGKEGLYYYIMNITKPIFFLGQLKAFVKYFFVVLIKRKKFFNDKMDIRNLQQ